MLRYTSGICTILQDSQGNYWFGSYQEGACKYDGRSFTYYTTADGLNDNQVRSIQEGLPGEIWFGTARGVCRYKNGLIINYAAQSTIPPLLPMREDTWQLASRDLWFNAGIKPGVFRYHEGRVSYLSLPIETEEHPDLSYAVTGHAKGPTGQLWIATYNAAVGYDGQQFEIIDHTQLLRQNLSGQLHIRSIYQDATGRLWIGNNGIGVLLKQGDSIINFSEAQGLIDANSFKNGGPSPAGTLEHVFAITEDSKGNIWFGDRDTGAWKFDGSQLSNYTVDPSLSNQMIWHIYEDTKGNLLFAMASGGVYRFDQGSFKRQF